MITKDNLKEVINMIEDKDKKRILENYIYEYVILELHAFNAYSFVSIKLSNDYNRYKNVSYNGNCILDVGEVKNLLEEVQEAKILK